MAAPTSIYEIGLRGIDNVLSKCLKNLQSELSGTGPKSYVDYTRNLRVEPICMVENTLANNEITNDLLQTLLSIFSGYYLQAVSVDATIGDVLVNKALDKLNPNRDPYDSVLNLSLQSLGEESLNTYPKLPELTENKHIDTSLALELFRKKLPSLESKDSKENNSILNSTSDSIKEIKDASNLAVGKLLKVEFKRGNDSVMIPIAIRFITALMTPGILVDLLGFGNNNLTMKDRYHGWRSGRLEFWRDIVFCRDLIDQHRKDLMNDKSGVYKSIINNKNKNLLSTLISGQPTVATLSNIAVITDESLRALESKKSIVFDNFKSREEIFSNTALMLVAVVDTYRNRVKIYHHSIQFPTELTFNSLKKVSKEPNNIMEILTAFQTGNAPVFK